MEPPAGYEDALVVFLSYSIDETQMKERFTALLPHLNTDEAARLFKEREALSINLLSPTGSSTRFIAHPRASYLAHIIRDLVWLSGRVQLRTLVGWEEEP